MGNPNGRAVHLKNLAQGLKAAGHVVSYVTMDYGQGKFKKIGLDKIYGTYRFNEGLPGLRFLTVKVPKLYRALMSANADVYVFMCAEGLAGIVSFFCSRNRKSFVFFGGSDEDFSGNYKNMSLRDKCLYLSALNKATIVVCQNGLQLRTLEDSFGIKGHVIYNPMRKAEYSYTPGGAAVWVGNYSSVKRPKLFVELAKQVEGDFIMAGGRQESMCAQEYENINQIAKRKGVVVKGAVSFEAADDLISSACVLVNTSSSEGISNTFLQAWRRGIPVVSFVDPDGMIEKYTLGKKVDSLAELVIAVKRFLKGISKDESMRIKDFFDKTFSVGKITSEFEEILRPFLCGVSKEGE